jgi:DNA-binding CsgD family transcriptional regulator
LCERGFAASDEVHDAAYLFPYLVTGTRALLGQQDVAGARDWLSRVERALAHRAIPGTLAGVDHARGLVLQAEGDPAGAERSLRAAAAGWHRRHRFWEGSWARLDLARNLLTADSCGGVTGTNDSDQVEARELATAVRSEARAAGAVGLVSSAEELLSRPRRSERWHPLTAREYSVAGLVAAGMTNREIAQKLYVAPKTVSAHVEHILTKLGAGRRAEIAAWATRVEAGV